MRNGKKWMGMGRKSREKTQVVPLLKMFRHLCYAGCPKDLPGGILEDYWSEIFHKPDVSCTCK